MFRVDLLLAPLLLLPERTEDQHHDHDNRDHIIFVKVVDYKLCIFACAKLQRTEHQHHDNHDYIILVTIDHYKLCIFAPAQSCPLSPLISSCTPVQHLANLHKYFFDLKINSPANPQKRILI